jgi:hypothetical protein
MAVARYDFTGEQGIKRGAKWAQQLIWKDPDDVPINLTGYTGKMQIRRAEHARLIAEFTTEDATMTLGGSAGTIDLLATATDTLDYPAGVYSYDLFLTPSGGSAEAILEGQIEVKQRFTH